MILGVVTSVKVIIFHLQMLIYVIHIFIFHFWMYITSQYVSYIRNIEFKIELKSYKCVIQGGYIFRGSLSQTYLLVIFVTIY
jgi:hypothetical protein